MFFIHVVYLCFVTHAGGGSVISHVQAAEDDPQKRKPDITKARTLLNWEPKVRTVIITILLLVE